MTPTTSITILGAGGIGCAIGHALLARGHQVEFVDADAEKVDRGNESGVEVVDHGSQTARFTLFENWHPGNPGLIILCTKCYDNATVLERLHPDSIIFPVQNGFDPELQSRCRFEGIASFVSECEPHRARTRITRPGDLHIGACGHDTPLPDQLRIIGDSLADQTIFTLKVVPDILPFKHTKLMYNAAISPLAAISGLDNGQLLTHAPARKLFFRFLRENYGILKQSGTELGTVGPFHPDTVNLILKTPLLGTLMSGPFSKSLRGTYCSMSGDIQTGRTEVENFNGHLVRLAGHHPCPLNRRSCDLINRLARDRATPSIDHLKEMVT
ncbi:MAG: ketopantoate reductase [Phycisphaerae bacterium]|nr:ketopantoate reductase [Phycisphaerae bacterium]